MYSHGARKDWRQNTAAVINVDFLIDQANEQQRFQRSDPSYPDGAHFTYGATARAGLQI